MNVFDPELVALRILRRLVVLAPHDSGCNAPYSERECNCQRKKDLADIDDLIHVAKTVRMPPGSRTVAIPCTCKGIALDPTCKAPHTLARTLAGISPTPPPNALPIVPGVTLYDPVTDAVRKMPPTLTGVGFGALADVVSEADEVEHRAPQAYYDRVIRDIDRTTIPPGTIGGGT